MKKITTILMLLMLTCMGAWAQDYSIVENSANRQHITAPGNLADGDVIMLQATEQTQKYFGGPNHTTDGTDDSYWKLVASGSSYKLVKLISTAGATQVYLKAPTATGQDPIQTTNDEDEAALLTFSAPATNYIRFTAKVNNSGADTYLNCNSSYSNAKWATGTGGWSYWKVFKTDATLIVVTQEQSEAYDKVQSWLPLIQNSHALVTDASNYVSNARQQDSEGLYTSLLDKNNATYFHSAWGGSGASVPDHDLQARLPEAVNSFYLFYVTRANGTGYPQAMRIDGSNNASDFSEAGGTGWTNSVASLSSLPSGATKSYLSDKISMNDAYQYLRFVPDVSYKDTYWFCLAEFWLFPSNEAVDAAIEMMRNVNSPLDITNDMMTTIDQIDTDLRSTVTKVTYVVKDESNTTLFTSTPQEVTKGTTITTLPTEFQRPLFYEYNEISETISSETTVEFTATVKEEPIFQFTADTSSPVWYNLKLKNSVYPTYKEDADPNVALPSTKAEDATTQWAFIGNPYEGFHIVNKAAGTDKVLGSATTTGSASTGGNTHATMGNGQNNELWTIEASGYYSNGFYIFNEEHHALNHRNDNSLDYWTGGYDAGSTFVATIVPDNYAQYVIDDLADFYEESNVDKYFFLTEETYNAQKDNYAAYSQYASLEQYNELKTATLAGIKYPETGYYRFKNTNRGRNSYLTYGVPSEYSNRGDGLVAVDESTAISDAGSIIKLTKTGDNNYTFGTEGMVVYAPTQNNYPFRTSGSEGDAVTYKFTVTSPGVVAIGPANVTDPNAQRYFHEGDGATWGEVHAVVQWTATSTASQWTIEEANELGQGTYALEIALTTIGDKSYATTYLPFPVTLSDDAEAYTVKIDGKKAVETLLGNEIPSEAPVLLISETAAEKVYATVAEVNATVSDNDLKGVYKKTNQADLEGELPVVLNVVNEKVGFYKLAETGSLPANKAFMSYTEGSSTSKEFFEEGFELGSNEATGIDAIENGANNGAIYNLQGQRVNKAQKGVFIQNGKKVVLK